MDVNLKKCITAPFGLHAGVLKKHLQYPHQIAYTVLDLSVFGEEIKRQGEDRVAAACLTVEELERLSSFRSLKRKKEWFGGRCAAKYAAEELFEKVESEQTSLNWSELEIVVDENGRPFLADAQETRAGVVTDISISHSGSLAAAMAVRDGYCGIDIQKTTPQVSRVRKRFCRDVEKRLLDDFFSGVADRGEAGLTKLWAAKEALRKVSCASVLPGFLELELIEIILESHNALTDLQIFVFNRQASALSGPGLVRAAVTHAGEYVLALTARSATLG